jgi:uridine kinase
MKKPYLVGIAGGSASGKTYLLHNLLRHFTTEEICLISQDHYYKSIEHQPRDENGEVNFDTPEGIDEQQLLKDIRALLQGETIQKTEYTFNVKKEDLEIIDFEPRPILVIEGLFILHFKGLFDLFDYKVFVDADEEIKLQRRLQRDLQERGYPEESIRYQWHNHVQPAYNQYLLPFKEQCDFIIHNNDVIDSEIELLSQMLRNQLL